MSNKRTDESSLGKSASVPLMHHIESDVRLFNDPAPNQQKKKIFSFELGIGSYLITPLHLRSCRKNVFSTLCRRHCMVRNELLSLFLSSLRRILLLH